MPGSIWRHSAFAHAAPGRIQPEYGAVLGPETLDLPNGPLLRRQLPGGITRWMAVPWQTDTASCRSGYLRSDYDPNVPTFWPARVPNQVLMKTDYDIVMDEERSLAERLAAFARRGPGCARSAAAAIPTRSTR